MNPSKPHRRAALALSTALLSTGLLVAGCTSAGSGAGPATGATGGAPPAVDETAATSAGTAAVLSLAIVPGLADAHVEALQGEVEARAGTGLSFSVVEPVDVQHTRDAEQQLVRAVADGTVDVAVVGARAFREMGVRDLDALLAPMTLHSADAQAAVLDTDLPDRMLEGLEPLGVTGLAVLPGPVRRPIAAGEPPASLDDFEAVPFFTWQGEVHTMAVEALGATDVAVTPEQRNAGIEDGSIRVFENSLTFLLDNPDWNTRTMVLNLELWPSVSVVLANPTALAELGGPQREALDAAVEATAAGAADRLPDEQRLVEQACELGAGFTVLSTPARAEIETALQAVHDELRSDPEVAAYLDEVLALTDGIDPVVPTVPDDCDGSTDGVAASPTAVPPGPGSGEATPLDGSYSVSWTVEELTEALGGDANPEAEEVARTNAGEVVLVIDRGRWDMVHEGESCPGTVEVVGTRVVLTATDRPSEWDCGDGLGSVVVDAAWSLDGDTLTLTDWRVPPEPDISWFARALLGSRPLERQP